jgi:hypothetical protein
LLVEQIDLHFHHVKNAEDVEEFWKTFSNYPSGGGTDIWEELLDM